MLVGSAGDLAQKYLREKNDFEERGNGSDEVTSGPEEGRGKVRDPALKECVVASEMFCCFCIYPTFR